MERGGLEKIVHSFRSAVEVKPEFDIFAMDGDNAFNKLDRGFALQAIKTHFPAYLPLLRTIYGCKSKAWFAGKEDGVDFVDSTTGVHQGCVSAMWMYAMGTKSFFQGIQQILGEEGFAKFFADDGNICGPFHKIIEAIQFILREGPLVGFYLNLRKGTYMLGRCGSVEEARQRRHQLITVSGIDPSIIRIHPDDVDEDIAEEARRDYGTKLLGSFIGSKSFVTSQLRQKARNLHSECQALLRIESLQVRMLLFRCSFTQKINHLLRTTPPKYTKELVSEFVTMKKTLLCSILDNGWNAETIPENFWRQCCLAICDGGLGLKDTAESAYHAFVASFVESLPTVAKLFPEMATLQGNSRSEKEFRKSLRHISVNSSPGNSPLTLDAVLNIADTKASNETLQGLLGDLVKDAAIELVKNSFGEDTHQLAWFVSITDSNAGKWLDVCPKSAQFEFSNAAFSAALAYRMFLQQPTFIPGSKCNCKKKPELDPLSHHLATGCAKGGLRNATHNSLIYTMKDLLNCCGIMSRREEFGCFRGSDENNNQRPDLSVYNMPGSRNKIVCDAQVTCPVPINARLRLSRVQALKPGRAATIASQQKKSKYRAICASNNLEFKPLIFESTGRMEKSCFNFCHRALNYMAKGNATMMSIYQNYWMSRISCVMQKAIANAILQRSSVLNGNLVRESNFEFTDMFIVEHSITH